MRGSDPRGMRGAARGRRGMTSAAPGSSAPAPSRNRRSPLHAPARAGGGRRRRAMHSPPASWNSGTSRERDEDRIDRHRTESRVGRILTLLHLVDRQELDEVEARLPKPAGESRQVGDLADAPARSRRDRGQRHQNAGMPAGVEIAPLSHPPAPAHAGRLRETARARAAGSRPGTPRAESRRRNRDRRQRRRVRAGSSVISSSLARAATRITADHPASVFNTSTDGCRDGERAQRPVVVPNALQHLAHADRRHRRSGRGRRPAPGSRPRDRCRK